MREPPTAAHYTPACSSAMGSLRGREQDKVGLTLIGIAWALVHMHMYWGALMDVSDKEYSQGCMGPYAQQPLLQTHFLSHIGDASTAFKSRVIWRKLGLCSETLLPQRREPCRGARKAPPRRWC
jgi:hypothetical protein